LFFYLKKWSVKLIKNIIFNKHLSPSISLRNSINSKDFSQGLHTSLLRYWVNYYYFLFSFNTENNADLKTDSNTLKSSAEKNPETAKPATNLSANKMIIALITKINKPKVTKVAGNVKKINKGLTTAFNTAITNATIIAETAPDMVTPGKIAAKTTTTTAVNKIFKPVFILINFSLKPCFFF
jgi:hypothetical protein